MWSISSVLQKFFRGFNGIAICSSTVPALPV